jgi:hypothetical protein
MAINAFGRAAVGAARRGTLEDGSLEVSNLNISEEFSDLIVAQRPLEARTPGGTTFDGVPEDTSHMICKLRYAQLSSGSVDIGGRRINLAASKYSAHLD